MAASVRLTIRRSGGAHVVEAAHGETLRAALLRHALSPYRGAFRSMNCKGLGVCGSCKVLVHENGSLWPRRSCQIRCFQDMQIELE